MDGHRRTFVSGTTWAGGRRRPRVRTYAAVSFVAVSLLATSGCRGRRVIEPVRIANGRVAAMTIAVAPALNQSGSSDFDPNTFADLMASELGYAEGIEVIPVNRVLAVLDAQGAAGVASPTHALELTRLLGADAILVFAVTEYDPYDPPTISISSQLYGDRAGARRERLDPVALSRQAQLARSPAEPSVRGLIAQTQRIFDASHESVAQDVRAFAKERGADDSPYGWRKFVVSQQHYIRFCCHETILTLLGPPRKAVAVGTMPGKADKR